MIPGPMPVQRLGVRPSYRQGPCVPCANRLRATRCAAGTGGRTDTRARRKGGCARPVETFDV